MDDEERFVTEEQFNNDRRFQLLQLRDQGVNHSDTQLIFHKAMGYTVVGIHANTLSTTTMFS